MTMYKILETARTSGASPASRQPASRIQLRRLIPGDSSSILAGPVTTRLQALQCSRQLAQDVFPPPPSSSRDLIGSCSRMLDLVDVSINPSMPPKRPPKRGSDEDNDKKRNKRHAKNKRGGEPTFDNYDEAMDGAIKQEEQGERYRDGDKAHRHYQRSKELYQKALDFDKTYDAAYNLARVHFVLATQFEIPTWSIDLLKTSISLYRLALGLTEDTLLNLDASYNLAESLIALADQLEDESSKPEAKKEVRNHRMEACQVLSSVFAAQRGYLEKQDKPLEGDGSADGGEAMDEDTAGEVEAPTASMAAETPGEVAGEQEASYEVYLPTPSALVDTALLLLSTHLALWSTTEPTQIPSDNAQATVRKILDATNQFCPPERQIELDMQEIKVLLTVDEVVYDSVKDTPEAQVAGSGTERSLLGSVQAFAAVGAGLEAGTESGTSAANEIELKADLLTSISEAYMSIAMRLIRQSTDQEFLAQAWTYLSTGIQNLQAAQALRMPALTRREFEASTCILLSQAELERARLSRRGEGFEAAKTNWSTLLTNAEAYCSKALDALGSTWKTLLSENVETPALAGWEQELLARNAVLQLLRVCHFAIEGAAPADQAQHKAKAEVVVENSGKLATAKRSLAPRDVERFVEDLVDNEGALGPEEMAFWSEVEKAVAAYPSS